MYEFTFSLYINCSLAPDFQLLSFYTTNKGFAVEDVVHFVIETCFEHEVLFYYSHSISSFDYHKTTGVGCLIIQSK